MPTLKTKQQLVHWIELMLGAPVIHLEVEKEQIINCIDEAILYFTRYSGDATSRRAYVFHASAGVNMYLLPDEIESVMTFDRASDVGSGIQVLFSPLNQMYNQGYINFFSASFGGGLTTFEMGMQYLELMHRTLEAQFTVEFNKYSHALRIIPTPDKDMFGVLEVYTNVLPKDNQESTLYDEWWIKNYALALTKIVLGRIWGKYSNMVIPGGATLNASVILAEGLAERQALEDKIIGVESEPLGFFVE